MKYICPHCGEIYEELTVDGMCVRHECWGEELVEYTWQDIERSIEEYVASVGEEEPVVPPQPVEIMEGLCLFVCGASGSMDEVAFPGTDLIRLTIMTRASSGN